MQIDRLIGILSVLLQRDKVTAPYLAEKFEVSRRTINRDIGTLCKAGIPVVTTQGTNGGISIMDGYRIDRTLLTSSDMRAILSGLQSLDSISGTNRYAQLMEKLSANMSDTLVSGQHILIDLSSHYGSTQLTDKIELIHNAIESHQRIIFQYFSLKNESIHEVEPFYLIFRWSSWYVWGWDTKKEDYNLFKLSRMGNLYTGDYFEKRIIPYPQFDIGEIFPDVYQIRAIVAPKHKWRIVDDYGIDAFTELEDGNLLFTFGQYDLDGALHFLLLFGADAEVLEPEELRERLKEEIKKMQEKYQT